MKRIARLFAVIVLSLIVVWISGGVALLHCAHTGATEIMDVYNGMKPECCMSESGCNNGMCCSFHSSNQPDCVSVPPCMDIEVVKLSPTTRAGISHFDFFPPVMSVLFNVGGVTLSSSVSSEENCSLHFSRGIDQAERQLLSLFCVLRI